MLNFYTNENLLQYVIDIITEWHIDDLFTGLLDMKTWHCQY